MRDYSIIGKNKERADLEVVVQKFLRKGGKVTEAPPFVSQRGFNDPRFFLDTGVTDVREVVRS